MPSRLRTIPIVDSLGRVQNRRIRSDRIDEYGKTIVNNRGKIAYQKLEPEEVLFRAAREEVPVRRVRLQIKSKYDNKGGGLRGSSRIKFEVELDVVVPADELDALIAKAEETILEAGIPPTQVIDGKTVPTWEVGIISNRPVGGGLVGVARSDVYIRKDRRFDEAGQSTRHEIASSAMERSIEAFLRDFEGVEAEARPGVIEKTRRAVQRTDKNGRRYWADPVTGQRTRDPGLLEGLF